MTARFLAPPASLHSRPLKRRTAVAKLGERQQIEKHKINRANSSLRGNKSPPGKSRKRTRPVTKRCECLQSRERCVFGGKGLGLPGLTYWHTFSPSHTHTPCPFIWPVVILSRFTIENKFLFDFLFASAA